MSLNIKEFKNQSAQFKLGTLTTESINETTKNLSQMVKENIFTAISQLQEVDKNALTILKNSSKDIFNLQENCQHVLKSNHRIFLAGCGATGRLALSLEKIFRSKFDTGQVVSFMAGGDYALIRSVESFEDNASFGARQLMELGFCNGDLLIGITEGGETSFVIGATKRAATESTISPYFIYCNPDDELLNIKRSASVLLDDKVKKVNLNVGAMAISGSTRMQATTVQQIGIGFALMHSHKSFGEFAVEFDAFLDRLINFDMFFIKEFIEDEAKLYADGGNITYQTTSDIGITILTDTTERSPTFSLKPFENSDQEHLSKAYLAVSGTSSSENAWTSILGREARCLSWDDIPYKLNQEEAYKFDISMRAVNRRELASIKHKVFEITKDGATLCFKLGIREEKVELDSSCLFEAHLALKLILNIHSTLVMGLEGRYLGNMMTYVRPSNYKLVDRAMRYCSEILLARGIEISEDEILEQLFLDIKTVSDKPIVIRVCEYFLVHKT